MYCIYRWVLPPNFQFSKFSIHLFELVSVIVTCCAVINILTWSLHAKQKASIIWNVFWPTCCFPAASDVVQLLPLWSHLTLRHLEGVAWPTEWLTFTVLVFQARALCTRKFEPQYEIMISWLATKILTFQISFTRCSALPGSTFFLLIERGAAVVEKLQANHGRCGEEMWFQLWSVLVRYLRQAKP